MANMLMRMLADYRPACVVVAWDERPTKRLELDPEYKAHRKPTPPLLQAQRPFFSPLVEAFGYRNIRVEGMEADDVIGTLSAMAERDGHRVCVVSTDRDAFQLASDNVCIMMTPRGVSDVVVYTPERIRQRYGIDPAQIPDFIGLKGDTSDNIPGVPGIGEKTAADLLVQFGSLEGIYAGLDQVPGEKRRESLRDHVDDAVKSKTLATIDRALDIDVDFAALVADPPDRSGIKDMFRKLEFRALLKRIDELDEVIPAAPGAPVERADMAWREASLADLAGLPHELAVSVRDGRAAVAAGSGDVLVVPADDPATLVDALAGHRVITHGEHIPGLLPAGDTQLAAYLLDPGRSGYEIADLAEEQGVAPGRPGRPRDGGAGGGGRHPDRHPPGAGRAHRAAPDDRALHRHRAAAGAGAGRDGALRRADGRLPDGRDRRQAARPGRRAGAGGLRAGRRPLHDRLAQAARRGAVRPARACPPTARARPATRPTRACWPSCGRCTP